MGSCYASDVLYTAHCYLGYKEGGDNWTVFSQLLDSVNYYYPQKKQGQPWCANFNYAVIMMNCVPEDRSDEDKKWDALYFTYQPSKNNYACAAYWGARYFEENNAIYPVKEARKGDIIFFKDSKYVTSDNPKGIYHQGFVDYVKDGRVYTIEGNKHDCVEACDYSLLYNKIYGVGRPRYDSEDTSTTKPPKEDQKPETPAPAEPTTPAPEPVKPTKTVDELAKEVIDGKWGNGTDRKNRLTAAGYDYNKVQNRVNELLKVNTGKKYKVNAQRGLNVRKGPGKQYSVLYVLSNGASVTVYDKKTGWGKIGDDQWVSLDYLK